MQFLPDQVCCHDNILLEENDKYSGSTNYISEKYVYGNDEYDLDQDYSKKCIKKIKLSERQTITTSLVVRGTRLYQTNLKTLINELFDGKLLNTDTSSLIK